MRICKSYLLLICLPLISSEISGYVQTAVGFDDGSLSTGGGLWVERIRTNFQHPFSSSFSLNLALDFQATYYRDLLPRHPLMVKQPLWDLQDTIWDKEESRGEIRLDRAYLSHQPQERVNLSAGKLRWALGKGWIFSATDVFNPLPPQEIFLREKRGVDGILLEWEVEPTKRISFGFLSVEEDKNAALLRYAFTASDWDIAFHLGSFAGRDLYAGEIAGPWKGYWLQWEGQKLDRQSSYLLGIHKNLSDRADVYAQYFRNGSGAKQKHLYPWIAFLRGDIQGVGKHYFASALRYQISALWDFRLIIIENLNDHSVYFNPVWEHSYKNDQDVEIGLQYFTGNQSEEFAFSSIIYVQHLWYF